MSMIDTWAATGAGAFSLSENGVYTLEGWRALLGTVNEDGIFTVSRWYSPGNIDETGRMIGLATAVLLDAGVKDARPQMFVANAGKIATLVLSKKPFTPEQLRILHQTVRSLGFDVLLAPDQPPQSPLLRAITESTDRAALDRVVDGTFLDLSVATDNRPFFFNQLRFLSIPRAAGRFVHKTLGVGVVLGNLTASAVLIIILLISVLAVIATILLPIKESAMARPLPLPIAGSLYLSLVPHFFI